MEPLSLVFKDIKPSSVSPPSPLPLQDGAVITTLSVSSSIHPISLDYSILPGSGTLLSTFPNWFNGDKAKEEVCLGKLREVNSQQSKHPNEIFIQQEAHPKVSDEGGFW